MPKQLLISAICSAMCSKQFLLYRFNGLTKQKVVPFFGLKDFQCLCRRGSLSAFVAFRCRT